MRQSWRPTTGRFPTRETSRRRYFSITKRPTHSLFSLRTIVHALEWKQRCQSWSNRWKTRVTLKHIIVRCVFYYAMQLVCFFLFVCTFFSNEYAVSKNRTIHWRETGEIYTEDNGIQCQPKFVVAFLNQILAFYLNKQTNITILCNIFRNHAIYSIVFAVLTRTLFCSKTYTLIFRTKKVLFKILFFG